MKLAFRNAVLTVLAVAAGLLLGSPSRSAQPVSVTTNGVTVTLQSPRTGDVVSNKFNALVDASSLAGPISRIEVYASNNVTHTVQVVGSLTNRFSAPANLFVY